MKREMFRTGVAFLVLVALASPALARKPTRSPEQGTWKVKVTPDADAAAKGEKQTEKKVEQDKVSQRSYTRPTDAAAWDKIEEGQRRDKPLSPEEKAERQSQRIETRRHEDTKRALIVRRPLRGFASSCFILWSFRSYRSV